MLQPLAGRAQERALRRGQRAIGLGHQVRVRHHHGLPARRLHHVRGVAATQGKNGIRDWDNREQSGIGDRENGEQSGIRDWENGEQTGIRDWDKRETNQY